ncbi:MAG: beta-galactosidase [Verrucomicrobiaceae bacterium]|nr:beta-galactosidase [Verrucomicrobiaceae bacterium]
MLRFALLLLIASTALALDLKPANDGVVIEAGSMGSFTFANPILRDGASKPVHKITEVRGGTIIYEGGGKATIATTKDSIAITFASLPDDVKTIELGMLIDIAYSQGGKWQIGDKAGDFPRAKASPPHLHSGNAGTFSLTHALGQSLEFTVPDFTFQQLTDNREWNWGIFHWMGLVPLNRDNPTLTIKLSTKQSGPAQKLVDVFGQNTREDWTGKVKSLDELKADVQADDVYYKSLQPAMTDKFGGAPGSGAKLGLKRTGFFHIEKQGDKQWLVSPEGNAFFHLGICGFAPSDDYTYVKGREGIYEWLPKLDSEFSSAFREGNADHFSFYLANTIKKFGKPHTLEDFANRMIPRVRAFGFNSIGAFSPAPAAAQTASFPYVQSLPINEWEGVKRIPGAWEVWDPFDDATAKLIAERIAKEVPARANDPLLIGWFIVNEPRYDELPRVIPSLPGTHACKQRFVASLKTKYTDIAAFNTAWQTSAASFDDLTARGIEVKTDTAKSDVKAFVGVFLDTLFKQVCEATRKADPNHLIIGTRLQPVTIEDEQLCRISGKYFDVLSYNYYTYGMDTAALRRYHDWSGLSLMLSEFFWSSPKDSGLTGGRELKTQQERGLAYRNYVEQAAATGFVIGIEWFTLIDQATTGRWFSQYSGESANTGLFSVADRPWKPMLDEMMKTNHGIYPLLFGERKAFAWDDERVRVK